MANVSKIKINETTYNIKDVTARSNIGNISTLETENKSSVVGAVNELNTKNTAVTAKVDNLNIINVCDYGAVGDGVTDDTQAFKGAIDDVPIHGTLYIPFGEYIISEKLSINKPMTILGAYNGFEIYESTADITQDQFKTPLIKSSTTDFAIEAKTLGFRMENVSITKTIGGHGVYLDNSLAQIETFDRYNSIKNCSIINVGNSASTYGLMIAYCGVSLFEQVITEAFNVGFAVLGDTNTSLTFLNCWARNYLATGYSIRNLYYSSLINCAADTISTTANGYILTACKGVELIGCGAEKNIGGYYFDSCKGVSLSGAVGTLSTRGDYGVVVRNSSQVFIHDFFMIYPNNTRPATFYPLSISDLTSKVILINTTIELIRKAGTDYNCTSGGFFESNVTMGTF